MVDHITGFFSSIHYTLFEVGALRNAIQQELPTERILPLIHRASANDRIDEKPPLYLAIEKSRLDLIEPLLREGASPFLHDDSTGDTAAHLAIRKKSPELLKTLLNAHSRQEELNCLNLHDSRSLLLLATEIGCIDCVRLLLEAGANPNQANGPNGTSLPLQIASQKGTSQLISLLVQHGANIHAPITPHGFKVLYVAAESGNEEAVIALLQLGARIDEVWNNQTALHAATSNGHAGVIKKLLAHGINRQLSIYRRNSPLELAIQRNQHDAAQCLLKGGFSANELNEATGENPFHLAAKVGNVAFIALFIESKAECNMRTKGNLTALYLACEEDRFESAKALIEAGASLDERCGPQRKTALQIASERKHLAIITLLLESRANFDRLADTYSPSVIETYLQCHRRRLHSLLELMQSQRSIKTLISVLEIIQSHFHLEKQFNLKNDEQTFEKVIASMLDLQGQLLSYAHKSLDEKFCQEAFGKALTILSRQQMILQMLSTTRFFPLVLEKTSLSTSIILSEKFSLALKAQQQFFKEAKERHLQEQMALEQLIRAISESIQSINDTIKIYAYLFHEPIREHYTLPLRTISLDNQVVRQDCNSVLKRLRLVANPQHEFDEEDVFCILERLFVSRELTRLANKEAPQSCLERLVGHKSEHIWNCGLREGKDLRLIGIDDDLLILLQSIQPQSDDDWMKVKHVLERMKQKVTDRNLLLNLDSILSVPTIRDKKQLDEVKREILQFHSRYCPMVLRVFLQKHKDELPTKLAKHACESLADLQKIEPLKTI